LFLWVEVQSDRDCWTNKHRQWKKGRNDNIVKLVDGWTGWEMASCRLFTIRKVEHTDDCE